MAEWQDITSNPQNHPQIVDIQTYGDTTYYTITPKTLPLVRPLHLIPLIGKPIADLIEPALRVIIEETGYNRDIPFGAPIGTRFIPFFNPITLFLKLVPAVFIGINNFLANFGLTTEIPLSPTDPITAPSTSVVSSLVNQQDQPMDNPDEFSGARMARVQEDGAVDQQQGEGDAQMLAAGAEGDLTEGTVEETEGTVEETQGIERRGNQPEGTQPEGTQPEGTEPEKTEIEAVNNTDDPQDNPEEKPEETKDPEEKPEETKEPEETKVAAGNRVDANGGSVSLNFSPNQPTGSSTTGSGDGTEQPDPADDPEPAAPAAEGSDSSDSESSDSDSAGQAAA